MKMAVAICLHLLFAQNCVFAADSHKVIQYEFNAPTAEYSPDGKQLAAIGMGRIQILDAASGKVLHEGPESNHLLVDCVWSTNGKTVIAFGEALIFFDVASGEQTQHTLPDGDFCSAAAISPDGKRLALGHEDGRVTLRNMETMTTEQTFVGHTSRITDLVWRESKLYSAGGQGDGWLYVWDTAKKHLLNKLPLSSKKDLRAIAVHPDGNKLLVVTSHDEASLWDLKAERKQVDYEGAANASAIAFLRDGETVLSSQDNDLMVWKRDGKRVRKLVGHDGFINHIAVSPDGKRVATTGGSRLILWETSRLLQEQPGGSVTDSKTAAGEPLRFDAKDGEVYAVEISPNDRLLAVASSTSPSKILIWDLKTLEPFAEIDAGPDPLLDVAFTSDSRYLIFQDRQSRFVIWEVRRKRELRRVMPEYAGRGKFEVSANGRFLLVSNYDGAFIVDLQNGKTVTRVDGHARPVRGIAFSPDEKTFATAGDDGMLMIWDSSTGRKLVEFPQANDILTSVAFSPDGTRLAVGGYNLVTIYNLKTKEPVILPHPLEFVREITISPDGQELAAAGDNFVRIWDIETGTENTTLRGHTEFVFAISYSSDGSKLASGSSDKTVKLWYRSGSPPQPSAPTPPPIPELHQEENWEVNKGMWSFEKDRIIGQGESRIEYKKPFANDFTFRCTMVVREGIRARIRFGSFHFGNEGFKKQLYLHGPKATGDRFLYKHGQEIDVEVTVKGDLATLKLDGQEVARSHPKTVDDRTLTLEAGDGFSKGKVEFRNLELKP